jgi:signal transduction histidine kinase
VAGHGGAIDARSNPGEGTTMTIRLPLEPFAAERVEPLKRSARPARGGAR